LKFATLLKVIIECLRKRLSAPPPQSLLVRSLRWVEKVLASVSDHVSLANRLYTTRDR
jgi:hypothetical protein